MILRRFAAAALIGASLLAAPASAAEPEVFTSRFSNYAVGGYDAVAYFVGGGPAKGKKEFSHNYNGAVWRFASAENLEKFQADPAAYAPQFGGYCAWAVAQGYTAPGNPENWSVRNGKLYLNYNDKVQSDWLKDADGFIAQGEANWPAVLSK